MNKKSPLIMLTAGALALLTVACGDTVVDADNSNPISPSASLSVLVQDAVTGGVVEGVSVTLISTGQSGATSANGTIVFQNIRTGASKLLIKKDGYAPTVDDASVPPPTVTIDGIYIAEQAVKIVYLYPAGSGLEGYLYYEPLDGSLSKPAVGAKVEINLEPVALLKRTDTATVDENGKYVFNGLPAVGDQYTLRALEYTPEGDGRTLASIPLNISNPDLESGIIARKGKETYGGDVSNFFAVSYPTEVSSTGQIVITFNDTVNVSKLDINTVAFYDFDDNPIYQAANSTWDKNVLTITTIGNWVESNFYIFLNGVTSVKGVPLSSDIFYIDVISTDPKLNAAPTGLAAANVETYENIELSWNKVTGASFYQLYVKLPSYNIFVPFGDSSDCDDTGTHVTATFYADEAGDYSFIVQAYNLTYASPFSTVKIVTVTDP